MTLDFSWGTQNMILVPGRQTHYVATPLSAGNRELFFSETIN